MALGYTEHSVMTITVAHILMIMYVHGNEMRFVRTVASHGSFIFTDEPVWY